MNLTALLALLAKPETQTILEGLGNALVTFAQHNKEHLGANASKTIAEAGAAVEEGTALAGSLA